MAQTQNYRPVTIILTDNHLRMMAERHLLNSDELHDMSILARVAQRIFDQALGLPEECWHEWDDWAKGLQ